MARLGGEFAGILRVSVPADETGALEAALGKLGNAGISVAPVEWDDIDTCGLEEEQVGHGVRDWPDLVLAGHLNRLISRFGTRYRQKTKTFRITSLPGPIDKLHPLFKNGHVVNPEGKIREELEFVKSILVKETAVCLFVRCLWPAKPGNVPGSGASVCAC